MVTVLTLSLAALIGYFVLRLMKNKLPPIILITCISTIYIGVALCILFIIQVSNNLTNAENILLEIIYMMLLPFNYILCSVRLLRQVITHCMENQKINEVTYKNNVLHSCQQLLSRSIAWYIWAFVLMIPLLCILVIILVLFGQKPDSVIRAFTETSDWTLSQKISPPPIEYEGHYLCTVAVNGHVDIVKPTRSGVRHGVKITVNRQLCVANAFEDLIREKLPRFHKLVRDFYDKYGFPLSKYITTPIRADVVYIVMKPLEYIFLATLYLFDINPENRIAMQYTGSNKNSYLMTKVK